MSYGLIDVNGKYLGDMATTSGMDDLYVYAVRAGAHNLVGFLDKGAALVTQALVEEIRALRPQSTDVRKTLDNLFRMLDGAELCVIIQDGVNVS